MLTRWAIIGLGFAMGSAPAWGQYGYPWQQYPGQQYQSQNIPSYYNPQYQPLSPYLNLMTRGGLSGVNYYYGVRPGLPNGGAPYVNGGRPMMPNYPNLNVQYSVPTTGQLAPGEGYVLPPAGHINTYGNFFGIAGNSIPGFNTTRGGVAPGLGNVRPQQQAAGKIPAVR
ncbi:MAG: hypothetical protein U0798_16305 [Gemmataceae bacterium]